MTTTKFSSLSIPLPSGSSRSGVTVAVMSGQTAYAEITKAPEIEAVRKPS